MVKNLNARLEAHPTTRGGLKQPKEQEKIGKKEKQ